MANNSLMERVENHFLFVFDNIFTKSFRNAGIRSQKYLEILVLALIVLMAFSMRLYSVIRYESVIHEFDPYFNFRTTKYLINEGPYEFWNWFDDTTWYPLGRIVGQTLYPGLMLTAATLYKIVRTFGLMIDIREICVFLAPFFSGLTAISGYLLCKEVTSKSEAGLLAALFVSISPTYMSRSVAGSYDNEAVAIFALIFSFYTYLRSVRKGTIASCILSSFAYFYMVMSWGGYVFITNVIAIFTLASLLLNRLTNKHVLAYNVWYILGTLLCLNIPFVSRQAIFSAEHLGSHGVFFLINALSLYSYLKKRLSTAFRITRTHQIIFFSCLSSIVVLFIFLTAMGKTKWSGRSLTLLDPTYASNFVPIIASISEHQSTTWGSFMMDLNALFYLTPLGLVAGYKNFNCGVLFMSIYLVLASYFSAVMIRLLLVLGPACAIISAIGVSYVISSLMARFRLPSAKEYESFPWLQERYRDSSLLCLDPPSDASDSFETSLANDKKCDAPKKSESLSMERQSSKKNDSLPLERQQSVRKVPTDPSLSLENTQRQHSNKKKGTHSLTTSTSSATNSTRKNELIVTEKCKEAPGSRTVASFILSLVFLSLVMFVIHCNFAANVMYSNPSVVIASKGPQGERFLIDDFRDAYSWLRCNTKKDAKIMSWWDYGYQLSNMSDRMILVDNNTWNTAHIATVGYILGSNEETAYRTLKELDVDYVMVVYGGISRYNGDDLHKFLWMVRIANEHYPEIKEADYIHPAKGLTIEADFITPKLRDSVIYKLSTYRMSEANNFDAMRNVKIDGSFSLKYFEEAYTSEKWLVRIFKVKDVTNHGNEYVAPNALTYAASTIPVSKIVVNPEPN